MTQPAFPKTSTPPFPRVTSSKRYGVFLVEDHPITRAGLAALVNLEEDLYICGDADNAPDALARIAKLEPAAVVSDITLRLSNGIELMKNLMRLCPHVPVLAVSGNDGKLYAEEALRAGARGYVTKEEASEKIIPAIRKILGGDVFLSDEMRRKLDGTSEKRF